MSSGAKLLSALGFPFEIGAFEASFHSSTETSSIREPVRPGFFLGSDELNASADFFEVGLVADLLFLVENAVPRTSPSPMKNGL